MLELCGLGSSLLEVGFLLLIHDKRWKGSRERDTGLEDCSGLGGGGVRNIPLV